MINLGDLAIQLLNNYADKLTSKDIKQIILIVQNLDQQETSNEPEDVS